MITLWRGWHGTDLLPLLKTAWKSNQLFILCPYSLLDFNFIKFLPPGPIETIGDWDQDSLNLINTHIGDRTPTEYPGKPILGIFTTGTVSGGPRLVLYSKDNVEASLEGIRTFFDTNWIKTIFCYPQPLHTFGLTLGYLQAMLYGLKLVVPEGRYSTSAHALWTETANETMLTLGVPTHFYDLVKYVKANKINLKNSYSCIIGGARVSENLWNDVQTVLKIEAPSVGYGATECAPGVTHHSPGRRPKEDGEIGLAIPGVNLEIKPEGLSVSGANVCLAIIHNDKIEFPDKIILSDIIRERKADGMLIYEGRTVLALNRGGVKFSLELMEEVLMQKLGLHAVCIAVPDERLGEDLGVVVSGVIEDSKIRQSTRDNVYKTLLDSYGIVFNTKNYTEVAQLPFNRSQKIDREACSKLVRGTYA